MHGFPSNCACWLPLSKRWNLFCIYYFLFRFFTTISSFLTWNLLEQKFKMLLTQNAFKLLQTSEFSSHWTSKSSVWVFEIFSFQFSPFFSSFPWHGKRDIEMGPYGSGNVKTLLLLVCTPPSTTPPSNRFWIIPTFSWFFLCSHTKGLLFFLSYFHAAWSWIPSQC